MYQATITRTDNNTTETYIGLAANEFKTRCHESNVGFSSVVVRTGDGGLIHDRCLSSACKQFRSMGRAFFCWQLYVAPAFYTPNTPI